MAGKLASSGGKGGYSANSEPNVIPFIDIMLVLLIIFMVAAPIPTVDIRVDLPPPNPVPVNIQDQRPTFVSIEDEGGRLIIFVDGQVTPVDQLGERVLERARINNPNMPLGRIYADARIFLRADQETAYGNVMRVMSVLQEEAWVNVGIVAEEAQI